MRNFYYPNIDQMFKEWSEVNFTHPQGHQTVLEQPLWCNSHIKIANSVVIKPKRVMQKVTKFKHIYDSIKQQWFTSQQIAQNTTINFNFLDLLSIQKAVPKIWFRLLKVNDKGMYQNLGQKIEKIPKISKWRYEMLRDESNRIDTVFRFKWENTIATEITEEVWNHSFKRIGRLTLSTKLRSFQYRLINFALITNVQLAKWNLLPNDLCTFCNLYKEDYLHFFCNCEIVQRKVWTPLKRWLKLLLLHRICDRALHNNI